MDDIKLTRALLAAGLQPRPKATAGKGRAGTGEVWGVRHGSLDLTIDEQHRRLVRGTVPQLREGAVLSHGSAAVLHGLPVCPEAVERVHVTRSRLQMLRSPTN